MIIMMIMMNDNYDDNHNDDYGENDDNCDNDSDQTHHDYDAKLFALMKHLLRGRRRRHVNIALKWTN